MAAASFNDLHRKELCVGGAWRPPASGLTLRVINPATEKVVGCIPAGGAQDVDSAVGVALEAFQKGTWSCAPIEHRAKVWVFISVHKRVTHFFDQSRGSEGLSPQSLLVTAMTAMATDFPGVPCARAETFALLVRRFVSVISSGLVI